MRRVVHSGWVHVYVIDKGICLCTSDNASLAPRLVSAMTLKSKQLLQDQESVASPDPHTFACIIIRKEVPMLWPLKHLHRAKGKQKLEERRSLLSVSSCYIVVLPMHLIFKDPIRSDDHQITHLSTE